MFGVGPDSGKDSFGVADLSCRHKIEISALQSFSALALKPDALFVQWHSGDCNSRVVDGHLNIYITRKSTRTRT